MLGRIREAISTSFGGSRKSALTKAWGRRGDRLAFETLENRMLLDGSPIISEFMAVNDSTRTDEDGAYSDWIEIHNPAATSIDVTGWKLKDGGNEWIFPSMSLGPGEFRTLFASGKDRIDPSGELHTNFSLKGGGEYLGLLDAAGTVVHEYDEYPSQTADISYGIGQDIDATMFVSAGDSAKYLIPDSYPTDWTTVDFPEHDSWSTGDTGIGFADTVPGFAVRNYKASVQVLDLSIALDVIADPSKQSSVHWENRDVVNYYNSGGHGHYLDEVDFPGALGEEDEFVVEATGMITIPSAGPWSFGVNSDDGFSLELTRGNDSFYVDFPGLRGNNDTIATFDLPEAGTYNLRLVFFEHGGGASIEAFAARGTYGSFDAGAFDLIGDTANGGLAIVSEPFGGSDSTQFVGLIETDVEEVMWDVNATMLVRIPFTVTDPSQLESLRLSMQYDDGFVAYLNGTEIASSNAPGSPTYSSSATAERTESQATTREEIDVSAYLDALAAGPNVLAIQAMNFAADDKDFLVLPELGQILYLGAGEHYFAVATPGQPNSEEYWLQVEDTKFSVDRGFYDSPFTLRITTETVGAEIYYTLDSSEPSATNGTLYDDGSPISINRTTVVRARAFMAAHVPTDIDTQTYLFLDDVVTQSPAGEAPGVGWPTSNVNGQKIDYGMDPDIVGGYNTVDEVKDSLLSLPTISMVTDLDNLFGASSGIIVNANMDGRNWERPASIELIYPEGATGPGFPDGADGGFQINAGVRIRGGYSRSDNNPKHAFRLFFRDEYGDSRLQYSLFGDEGADEFKKVDLRTSQNYSWAFGGPNNNTMVRELYSREVQGALGHQYTRGRFYHLYIDGVYWGVFQTDEREEANFAETYYGGDSDDYDVIKPQDNRRVFATDGNLEAYDRLWDATANIGYADTANYYRVQGMNTDGTPNPAYERLLDVDNVIDYMIITYYTGDRDGPGSWYTMGGSGPNNFFAIYNRENPDGFKFFEHDSEHSLGTGQNNMVLRGGELLGDTATEGWSSVAHLQNRFAPHWLHERLVQSPEYRQRFSDRMYEVFYNGGEFDYPNSLARINDIAARVDEAMIAESARWGDTKTNPPKNHADWVGDVNEIRNWIVGRSDTVVNQVKSVGWYPSTAPAAYQINGAAQHGGTIRFGDVLTITAPAGTIYYTLDGTDPADGGSVYSGPIVMNDVTHVRTRVLAAAEWSPLSKTTFYIDIASDIRITELMYNPADPTPAEFAAGHTNNDDFEYIEIKNLSTTEALPLMNLRLTDAIIYTFPEVWIGPGEFIVLAKSPAAFNFRYDTFVGTVVGPYDAGSLNNAGEMLQLDSPVGGIIHRFTYKDGWYGHTDGDGFSLTIRDPGGDAALWDSADGWRASAAIGGTPGYEDTAVAPGSIIINEVLAHSDAPFVDTIELYNTTGAAIDIGGWFLSDQKTDALGVEMLTKYQLPGGSIIAGGGYLVLYEDVHFGAAFALSEHGDDVYLSSNAAGAAGGYREHVDFGASPTNVSFGLYTKSTGGTDFTLLSDRSFGLINDPPYLEDLVINEVMYHPAAPSVDEIAAGYRDDDSFEFVEIYNRSTTASYTLSDFYLSNGVGFTFGWVDADSAGNESRTLETGATATWNASLPAGPADYELFARWDLLDALGNERNLDGRAAYAITHAGGTATVIRDQKPELLDEGPDYIDAEGWVSLGTYSFDGSGQIVLSRGTNNPGNWTIADQVKFVRAGSSDVIVDDPTLDSRHTANGPTTIGPGQYVVLVSDYDAFDERYDIAAGGIPVVGVYTGNLDNNGEKVKLMRAGDPEAGGYLPYYRVDYVNYNDIVPWPLEADGRGSALNRIDADRYGNDPINWNASLQFGTPGAENDSIDPTAPSVPGNFDGQTTVAPDTVSLTWDASTDGETFVDHYRIYRDGDLLDTSPTASFDDTDVAIAVWHSYQVSAVNRDGYESGPSATIALAMPGIVSYGIPDTTHIEILFTEPLDPVSAGLLSNYALIGGTLTDVSLVSGGTKVILTMGEALVIDNPYSVTVNNVTAASGNEMLDGQQITFSYVPLGSGSILREYWLNIGGGAIADLTSNINYPDNPTGTTFPTSLDGPVNWANNYGTRWRGYVHPPTSGDYTFWIAGDDNSELYLSTDDDPLNMVLIANVPAWSNWHEWDRDPAAQESDPITLQAGQKYYIEVLHKEGSGGDNISVRWQLPGGVWENPADPNEAIPGIRLSPIAGPVDETPPTIPGNLSAEIDGSGDVLLSWDASIDPQSSVDHYVIYRDGSLYAFSPATDYTDTNVAALAWHTYEISAVNPDDAESAVSMSLVVVPLDIDLPDPLPVAITVDSLLTPDTTPGLSGTIDDPTVYLTVNVSGVDFAGRYYPALNVGDGTWTLGDDRIQPPLADGTYEVTVWATDLAGGLAFDSTVAELVIDTNIDLTPPQVDIIDVAADPRNSAVGQIVIVFTEPITALELGDLSLSRDGGPNLLPATASLASADNITWTLSGLSGLTDSSGSYTLTLSAAGSGIQDEAGNLLADDASDSWTTDMQAPTADIVDVTPDPRDMAVEQVAIVFDEPVTGLQVGDLTLTRDGGPNLLTGGESLQTTDNLTWILAGLKDLTSSGEGFVAFNDHIAGPTTHANTTSYAGNGRASGPMKSIVTGLDTGVTLTITAAGAGYDDQNSTLPAEDTDAYNIFNGFVDFSPAGGDSIEIAGANHYTHTFTGLDTGDLATYDFAGTAIRGKYSNRWILVTLVGADAATAAHSSGDYIQVVDAYSVAIISGENDQPYQGVVAAWTGIDPGADGSFAIVSTHYQGVTPVGNANGRKAYALSGIRLAEVVPDGLTGDYLLTLTADGSGIQDAVGNLLTDDATDQWAIDRGTDPDTDPPTVDIVDVTPDPRNVAVNQIEIVFDEPVTGLDLTDLSLSRDGGPDLALTGASLLTADNITWTLSGLGTLTAIDGNYLLTLTAAGSSIEDAAGNALNEDATEAWDNDVTAPTVTIDPLATNDNTPTLTGTIDDPTATIVVQVGGTDYPAINLGATWSMTVGPLGDGTYDVIATATDAVGNVGTDTTADELTIDVRVPTVTIDLLTTNDNTPTLTGTIDDPTATIVVQVGGTGYPAINLGATWSMTAGPLDDGTYDVIATATDPVGNVGTDATTDELTVQVHEVLGRHIFYNRSGFDGNDPGANSQDDAAIAPDKRALLPGQTATFENYTSYSRGINGVMVDINDLPGTPGAADFEFAVGNGGAADWSVLPIPPDITVRRGEGDGGSDRVTIIWKDNSIESRWLRVTVRATANTGLARPDLFYFGNAPGEAGDNPIHTIVNATDEIAARNFQHSAAGPALIDDPYDYSRDGLVNGTDQIIARENQTNPLTMLRLIEAPAVDLALAQAVMEDRAAAEAPSAALDWLYEYESIRSKGTKSNDVEATVDRLLATDWA